MRATFRRTRRPANERHIIKLKYNYDKNPEKAYAQVLHYVDHLGQPEGWLVVFDPKLGDWDAKLRHEDVVRDGKTVHVFFC